MIRRFRYIFFTSLSALCLFYGCANQQQPGGGPKDETPPKVMKEVPSNLSRNFSGTKIEIEFDEFVRLKNEFSEISISPALEKMPSFKAHKKEMTIKFDEDSPLEKNTTYMINFGKAIVDVNEGNVLKNYSYVFSTGPTLDSLSISGNVRSVLSGKALKDALVFILPVSQDSLFGKKKANMFTMADSAGNFALNNLRADTYRIYALKKPSGSERIYNPETDEIAFLNDSLVLDKHIRDIQLNVFKEVPSKLRNRSDKIDGDGRISIVYNKPISEINILSPAELNQKKTVELGSKKDSAFIWLPELTFDSLKIEAIDSDHFKDTLVLNRSKRDTYDRRPIVADNLLSGDRLKQRSDLVLSLSAPIADFDAAKMSLLQDSIPLQGFKVVRDNAFIRRFVFKYGWKAKKNYILEFKEGTFVDIYGAKSKAYKKKISLDSPDNYGDFSLAITLPDTTKSYLVQCFNDKEVLVRTDRVSNNTTLKYNNFPIGKYHVRVIYDANKNGQWDAGSLKLKRQPEMTWNPEKEIQLRANWEIEESLAIPAAR